MDDIHIDRAARADIPALLTMIEALAAHHGDTSQATSESLEQTLFSEPSWSHALIARGQTQGALMPHEPLGYAVLTPSASVENGTKSVVINHLFVAQRFRGRKIGQALIGEAARWARERGCSTLKIGTAPGNNAAAETYLHLGFAEHTPTGRHFSLTL